MNNKWRWAAIAALALLFCMFNPITRQIIFFLLPFGGGVDDLVVIALLGGFGIFFALNIITGARITRARGSMRQARTQLFWGVMLLVFALAASLGLLTMFFI